MQSVGECPVCAGTIFHPTIQCGDHSVSHETFQIVQCDHCSLLITTPRPNDGNLGRYYVSENYISHSTHTRSAFDFLYRVARSFSIRRKLQIIKQHADPHASSLLDFGCGTGEFLATARKKYPTIAGVEPSATARTHANTITGGAVSRALHLPPQSADVITLWHVLEHLPNLADDFSKLVATLRTNGTIFIAVPNHLSHDARHYKNFWAGYDVPRHLWHFNRPSMEKFLARHQLKLHATVPLKLDAYYVSMLSEQYIRNTRDISTLFSGLARGLKSNRLARKTNEYSSLLYIARK